MKRVKFVTLLSLAALGAARGQARPPLIAAAEGDSIRLYVVEVPATFRGFVVYGGPAGGAMTRLTAEPIRPLRDPIQVGEVLQGDRAEIFRVANVSDEAALLRKTDSDPMAASVLTFTFPRAADALGRRWSGVKRGSDTLLTYRVVFVDGAGRETSQSLTTQVARRDIPPATPQAVAGREQDGGVRVSWAYPQYRGGTTDLVYGFNVYRGRAAEMPVRINPQVILRDATRSPSMLDGDAAAGGSVTYLVRAVDILGREGAASASFTMTLPDRLPPSVPGQMESAQQRNAIILTWPVSTDRDLRGYYVERSRGLNQLYTRLTRALLAGEAPTFTDSSASGGTQYFYRVVAVDSTGNERAGNPLSVIVSDNAPPTSPADLRAVVVGKRRLRLSWTPSTAPDVIGYFIYRGMVGSAMTRVNNTVITGRAYLDAGPDSVGMMPGRRYAIAIEAVDGAFNASPQIRTEVLVPDDDPPAQPSAFGAENVLGRYVRLAWSASVSLDTRGYAIERSVDGGARTLMREVPVAAARELTDTSVTHGRRYTYSLLAVDSAGNRSSARVDSLLFGDPTPPPSPRNAFARGATPSGVTVHWERVVDLELAGYVVYRSTLPTGNYVKMTASPVTTLEWTDRAGTNESWYIVRAVDRSGNESASSPPVRVPPQ